MNEDVTYYDENTLFKVRDALRDLGLEPEDIGDVITVLLNAGILFRERAPEPTADVRAALAAEPAVLAACDHATTIARFDKQHDAWLQCSKCGAELPAAGVAAEPAEPEREYAVHSCVCGHHAVAHLGERNERQCIALDGCDCKAYQQRAAGASPVVSTAAEPTCGHAHWYAPDKTTGVLFCLQCDDVAAGCALSHPHAATKRCPG